MQFRWIDWNRDHVAEHGVEPAEAEMVVRNAKPPFPDQIGNDKLYVVGRGFGGRFLQVIYILDPDDAVFCRSRSASERPRKETLSQENSQMSRKKTAKPYWEMTTEELREATKEFDKEFVFERAEPMTPEMKARWERAKNKGEPATNGQTEQTIAVRLDKVLLRNCTSLAKKKRLSRDALIACGLRVLLAAEGLKDG